MVGADNEIWDRRTCQAVRRERFRGVHPTMAPYQNDCPTEDTYRSISEPGPLGQILSSTEFLTLEPRNSEPLPLGHGQSLNLNLHFLAQAPGLMRDICGLAGSGGRASWNQI